jgi:hypothetical protein
VHVLFGQSGRWPDEIDLAPGALPSHSEARVTWLQGARGSVGSDAGDTLGYSAAVADLDGDGRSELVTNEMLGNGPSPPEVDVGNLVALSGALLGGLPACSDGIDNDADETIDFPEDPGCTGPEGDSERARIVLCGPLDPLCGRTSSLEGALKIRIKKVAKLKETGSADASFGIGTWTATTGDGDVLSGAYAGVGKKRNKLELTLDSTSVTLLLDRIAARSSIESGLEIAVDLRNLPRLTGKLRRSGSQLHLRLAVDVLAETGGKTRKGRYRWKLEGPLVAGS